MSTPDSSVENRPAAAQRADHPAPSFRGVNHFSLTVTDLAASERFYTEVLGFTVVLDFGYGLVCLHKQAGFTIGLIRHEDGTSAPFSELQTGLDHLGLTAASRDELVAWEERFWAHDVTFTPIRDMDLGYHLNFRDPDGIALELFAPNAVYAAALEEVRVRNLSDAEVRAAAERLVAGEYVRR